MEFLVGVWCFAWFGSFALTVGHLVRSLNPTTLPSWIHFKSKVAVISRYLEDKQNPLRRVEVPAPQFNQN
jgi:hypothetical protein